MPWMGRPPVFGALKSNPGPRWSGRSRCRRCRGRTGSRRTLLDAERRVPADDAGVGEVPDAPLLGEGTRRAGNRASSRRRRRPPEWGRWARRRRGWPRLDEVDHVLAAGCLRAAFRSRRAWASPSRRQGDGVSVSDGPGPGSSQEHPAIAARPATPPSPFKYRRRVRLSSVLVRHSGGTPDCYDDPRTAANYQPVQSWWPIWVRWSVSSTTGCLDGSGSGFHSVWPSRWSSCSWSMARIANTAVPEQRRQHPEARLPATGAGDTL